MTRVRVGLKPGDYLRPVIVYSDYISVIRMILEDYYSVGKIIIITEDGIRWNGFVSGEPKLTYNNKVEHLFDDALDFQYAPKLSQRVYPTAEISKENLYKEGFTDGVDTAYKELAKFLKTKKEQLKHYMETQHGSARPKTND